MAQGIVDRSVSHSSSQLQVLSLFLQMCIEENLREYEKACVTAVGGGGISFPLVFGKERGDGPGT